MLIHRLKVILSSASTGYHLCEEKRLQERSLVPKYFPSHRTMVTKYVLKAVSPYQPTVAFYIETSHLMTGSAHYFFLIFCMKLGFNGH